MFYNVFKKSMAAMLEAGAGSYWLLPSNSNVSVNISTM